MLVYNLGKVYRKKIRCAPTGCALPGRNLTGEKVPAQNQLRALLFPSGEKERGGKGENKTKLTAVSKEHPRAGALSLKQFGYTALYGRYNRTA